MTFIFPKQELNGILVLAIPLIIANISFFGMGLVDTIMAGQSSALDLAGLSLGANIWLVAEMAMGGIISAMIPRVARLLGAKQQSEVTSEVEQGLILGLFIGIALTFVLLLIVPLIPAIGAGKDINEIAQMYLPIIAISLPASAVIWVVFCVAEGHAKTRFAVVSSLIALGTNVVLDYIFVFGKFGFPKMGGVGCALTTTVIYWVWAIVCIIYLKQDNFFKQYPFFSNWPSIDFKRWGAILALGLPISVSLLAESGLYSASVLMIAPLGIAAIGAHQITLQIAELALMISMGVGQATAIRIAHSLGGENYPLLRRQIVAGIILVIGICLFFGSLSHFGNNSLSALFTDDKNILLLSSTLLLFGPIFLTFDGIQVWAAQTLRGFEDVTVPMILQVSAYWLIGFPLGYSLGRTEFWGKSYGVFGFWTGLLVGVCLCSLLLIYRLTIKAKENLAIE